MSILPSEVRRKLIQSLYGEKYAIVDYSYDKDYATEYVGGFVSVLFCGTMDEVKDVLPSLTTNVNCPVRKLYVVRVGGTFPLHGNESNEERANHDIEVLSNRYESLLSSSILPKDPIPIPESLSENNIVEKFQKLALEFINLQLECTSQKSKLEDAVAKTNSIYTEMKKLKETRPSIAKDWLKNYRLTASNKDYLMTSVMWENLVQHVLSKDPSFA